MWLLFFPYFRYVFFRFASFLCFLFFPSSYLSFFSAMVLVHSHASISVPPCASGGGGDWSLFSCTPKLTLRNCVRFRQTTSGCRKSNSTVYKHRISMVLTKFFWTALCLTKFFWKALCFFTKFLVIILNKRKDRECLLQARCDNKGFLLILMYERNDNESPSTTRFDFEGCILTLMFKLVSDSKASHILSPHNIFSRNIISRDVPPLSVCTKQLDDTFSDFLFLVWRRQVKWHYRYFTSRRHLCSKLL